MAASTVTMMAVHLAVLMAVPMEKHLVVRKDVRWAELRD